MTKHDFLDQPPGGAALTAYDRAHLKLYVRLLDAEADGADWREAVRILFGLRPEVEHEDQLLAPGIDEAAVVAGHGFPENRKPRRHADARADRETGILGLAAENESSCRCRAGRPLVRPRNRPGPGGRVTARLH